jgi:penicillin amidase
MASENTGVQENSPGSNNWAISGRLTASGKVIVANDPHRNVSNPSIRYIVHLNAPGWDMIGATEAPFPGVAIGHNGRVAWGLTIVGTDQSDVYVETVNRRTRTVRRGNWEELRIVRDTIRVKGAELVVELKYSRHGRSSRGRRSPSRVAMRSTMHEQEAAVTWRARMQSVDNCAQFLDALVFYKAPTENMVCGDTSGNIAWQASAASPRRPNWHGRLPVPGTGEYEWAGFRDDLPREFNPARGWMPANDIPRGYDLRSSSRAAALVAMIALRKYWNGSAFTMTDMQAPQRLGLPAP